MPNKVIIIEEKVGAAPAVGFNIKPSKWPYINSFESNLDKKSWWESDEAATAHPVDPEEHEDQAAFELEIADREIGEE